MRVVLRFNFGAAKVFLRVNGDDDSATFAPKVRVRVARTTSKYELAEIVDVGAVALTLAVADPHEPMPCEGEHSIVAAHDIDGRRVHTSAALVNGSTLYVLINDQQWLFPPKTVGHRMALRDGTEIGFEALATSPNLFWVDGLITDEHSERLTTLARDVLRAPLDWATHTVGFGANDAVAELDRQFYATAKAVDERLMAALQWRNATPRIDTALRVWRLAPGGAHHVVHSTVDAGYRFATVLYFATEPPAGEPPTHAYFGTGAQPSWCDSAPAKVSVFVFGALSTGSSRTWFFVFCFLFVCVFVLLWQ